MEGQGLHEGQVVWLQDGGHRSRWTPLKIVRVCKQYVECSDGMKYHLTEGRDTGSQRGFKGGQWSSAPYITTRDQSRVYEAQEFRACKDRAIEFLSSVEGLTEDQLSQILAIAGNQKTILGDGNGQGN